MLIVQAAQRLPEPSWVGLGAMGFFFAAAAILFIWAAVAGLRAGTAMRDHQVVYPASVLMLAGSACMVAGMIISHTRRM
ncbi:hypothetical protein [Longimicrobium terrae]|uniref:Uncharacterized protein n=1 Tax=Longimicrobium terrae TaxID=1639882 RepID=A0A841GUA5_9BACT|nr:hypothetical protein [Longimicrobium terrae]MBB4635913.1 hypothetical protein [Longimicrobium terrae]MBB6070309.1 hypothetical protein [Longimicrobium terrae]